MVRRHWFGISRWIVSGINNGVTEALAGLIRAVKRKARGLPRLRTLITIVYLLAGMPDF